MDAPIPPVQLSTHDRSLVASLLRDAAAARSTTHVGEIGEAIAQVWLVAGGWHLVLQDLGERGVDALYLDLDMNTVWLTEVKTTRTGRGGFRTSRHKGIRQAGPEWVRDRLARGGFDDLETVESMAFAVVGVKIDVRSSTIRFFEPDEDAGRWHPTTEAMPLL